MHAPDAFSADFIRVHFLEAIVRAAHSVFGRQCPVLVRTLPRQAETAPAAPREPSFARSPAEQPAVTPPAPRPLSALQLDLPMRMPGHEARECSTAYPWRFSFEDFVVGPCNELAYAASRSMCNDTGGTQILYLASPPGLGKTHLLQAAGRMLTECCNRCAPKVEYLTAEEFVSRLWLAIKGQDTDRFKARYRATDLLLLEDVHFLQGKGAMQAELLATLKALGDRGSRVLCTSSFQIRDLRNMDEQLLSRLSAGLLSDIERPDEETRRRIFRRKAASQQVDLPEEVAEVLARHINADVRQMESCLHNLAFKARLYNSAVTMQMAWEAIRSYGTQTPCLNMDAIIELVCKSFGLLPEQMRSSRRTQELVSARNTVFYLARKHTDLSLEAIGQHFHRRHSTVIKGITSLEREMSRQSPLGNQVASAISLIERNGARTF
ncbi:MAG: ATP-binding protein [Deltaproteobacteria bacterium]|nr:ATP-binding protein [Deltaproteobacteria bacterium]